MPAPTRQTEYGFGQLTPDQVKEIHDDPKREAAIRNLLGVLEHMATGLRAEVYDKRLMFRMSATFIIQIYDRLKPYIDEQKRANATIYREFEALALEFDEWKKDPTKQMGQMEHS